METIEVKSNNVNCTLIKTDKFKTITIQIVFLGEFSRDNATKRSLLTRVLTASTKSYPTKKAIANKLFDLYDASVSVSVYPSYKTSITVFSLDIVNEKNLNSDSLTKEALTFFRELMFNPNADNNAFNSKDFAEQKRILKQNIKNIYNNKNRYALRKLLNNMAPDEIISVSSLGTLEDLEIITAEDLFAQYQSMITTENVSIYCVGDFDEQKMLEDLKILGDFPDNPKPMETVSEEDHKIEKVREYIEKQNINQSKLIMGFRNDVNTKSPLFLASLLFNAMFGGLFASDLIRVVREANSLAYTIASQIMNDVKVMIVSAGIDENKYQMTSDLVIKQLELYKQGQFGGDNFEIAKDSIASDLAEIEDSPYMIINFILRNYLHDIRLTVGDMLAQLDAITLGEIQEVAKGTALDTIYLLAGDPNA